MAPSMAICSGPRAFSIMAANFFAFSWIASMHIQTAVPPTAVARLPKVPIPYCTTEVSPWVTTTSSGFTPSLWHAICVKLVSCP